MVITSLATVVGLLLKNKQITGVQDGETKRPNMAVTNPKALRIIAPEYGLDQIIGVFTGTINIGAPTSGQGKLSITDVRPHGFGDSCYFQGIFTTDGGVTYNDFGAQTPNLAAPNPQFQSVDVEAMVDQTNVNVYITNYYDNAHSTSQAYTVTYKIYLLAKNTMALPITPIKTNQKLAYDSRFNFQKIKSQGTVSLAVISGSTGGITVIHNLGYLPKVRSFFSPAANPKQVFSINQIKIPPITSPILETRVTNIDVTFFSDQSNPLSGIGFTGTLDYRIYLDS
jgi:hypothetical protein